MGGGRTLSVSSNTQNWNDNCNCNNTTHRSSKKNLRSTAQLPHRILYIKNPREVMIHPSLKMGNRSKLTITSLPNLLRGNGSEFRPNIDVSAIHQAYRGTRTGDSISKHPFQNNTLTCHSNAKASPYVSRFSHPPYLTLCGHSRSFPT